MARRFDHLNEAIAEAKRLSDVLCARMIVRLSYGKFSVVDSRSHGSKAPIVWKPESKVKPMTVPNTPQMARMAETMTYEQMSEKTGYTFSQLVAAVRKYGWDKKPRDVVEIDIDWLEVQ